MASTGIIYLSMAFFSCITRENWLLNDRATLKGSKFTPLTLDAIRGRKNQEKEK